jgi:hypothetical protein
VEAMSLRSDSLDSVGELYTEDDFRQLVVAIEGLCYIVETITGQSEMLLANLEHV